MGMKAALPASGGENLPYGYRPENIYDLTDEEKENLTKYLEANKRQLDALAKALEIGWFRESIRWEDGNEAIFYGLSELKCAITIAE